MSNVRTFHPNLSPLLVEIRLGCEMWQIKVLSNLDNTTKQAGIPFRSTNYRPWILDSAHDVDVLRCYDPLPGALERLEISFTTCCQLWSL